MAIRAQLVVATMCSLLVVFVSGCGDSGCTGDCSHSATTDSDTDGGSTVATVDATAGGTTTTGATSDPTSGATTTGATTGGSADDDSIVELALGSLVTCVVLKGGALRCWGEGGDGQLGLGTRERIGDDEHPNSVEPVALDGEVLHVASGSQTCALLSDGVVRCWGQLVYGVSGYGVDSVDTCSNAPPGWCYSGEHCCLGDDELPAVAEPVNLGVAATQLSVGGGHACVLLADGSARCWGRNEHGQLGLGHTDDIGDDEPAGAGGPIALGGAAIQISAGGSHTCALLEGGDVRCWGSGDKGKLGYGSEANIGDDETPEAAGFVALGGPAVQIEAGGANTCALLEDGAVRCWGWGGSGALGRGDTATACLIDDDYDPYYACEMNPICCTGDDETPAEVAPIELGGPATQISVDGNVCARLEGGAVRCWGDGWSGTNGLENKEDVGDDEAPGEVGPIELGGAAKRVVVGGAHVCAEMLDGALRCWGNIAHGQLGYADSVAYGQAPGSMPPPAVMYE